MSRWEPHIDLMRLLEALGRELVATTELEVRQACAEDGWSMARAKLLSSAWPELQVEGGSSMARTAKEVRELIEAVTGDPGDAEIGVEKVHFELRGSRHLQGAAESGRRICYKQH
jgi:hypothetical protein